MKKLHKAEVKDIQKVSCSSYYLKIGFEAPVSVSPGQFVSIYCSGLTLRRPFSVYSNDDGNIGLMFKERGSGTQFIKSLKTGDSIDVMGPLGNGFKIQNKKSLLIGAGIGFAPISFLKSVLEAKAIENCFCCGFLNAKEVPSGIKIDKIYTDDGTFGEKGSVLDYIEDLILNYKPEIIYACGPYVVLKNAAEIAKKYGIDIQVAMEKVMACAIGVCRGCVIDIIKDGKTVNASVCKDGPVFDGNEVVWQN